ncbi:hypothetical protein EMCRGX_G006308 [Ephydatia muelleri]
MLPFELHSSAKIFNAIADALEWRLKVVRVPHVYYYLDDFTVLGAPGTMSALEQTSWFQWRWGMWSHDLAIAVKELLPIVLAALIWGPAWHSPTVLSYCDNQAVVAGTRHECQRRQSSRC